MAGCASMSSDSERPNQKSILPTTFGSHWDYLYGFGSEPNGYAVYSYVLLGTENGISAKLYSQLLSDIKSVKVKVNEGISEKERSLLNVFMIPSLLDENSDIFLPDIELSKSIINKLSVNAKFSFGNAGPYIISVAGPIKTNENKSIETVLYVDLTGVNEKAFPEIVNAYEQYLFKENIIGINEFEAFRLSLLSFFLHIEDNIGIASSVYADVIDSFTKK